jgi:hypothetical protein
LNSCETVWSVAGRSFSRTLYGAHALKRFLQKEAYENDEPQPQEWVALGLMKLKPCRISVSS